MKKKEINELIDKNNALIGTKDKNEYIEDVETQSNRITDYNSIVHGQNFGHDFLGRFGFYFYENDGDNVNVKEIDKFIRILKTLKDDMFLFFKENNINNFKFGFDKYIKSVKKQLNGLINESNLFEDKIQKNKDDEELLFDKKNETEFTDNVKNVAELLSKLSKNDVNQLITLLEKRKNNE